MAERKKKAVQGGVENGADLSARLEAATGNIDRVSQDTVARRTEQKENMKRNARDARARARGSEKQRIADEVRAGEITRQKIAELEYAEDYRKKLQRERSRSKDELRRSREAALAEEREQRSREIKEQLEKDRTQAMERTARAEALLERIAKKNEEVKQPAEEAVTELPVSNEEMPEEEAAAPAALALEEDFEVDFEDNGAEAVSLPPMAAESYSDDRVVVDLFGGEDFSVDIDMNDGIPASESLESEGETVVSDDEDVQVVDEQVVGEYPDPKLSSNPIVAAIQTLGRSVYTTSGYRKYLEKSKSAIKEFKRMIAASEQIVYNSSADDSCSPEIVKAIKDAAAIIEIRCDNLRLAVKYGQKQIEETKSALSADIERYNAKVAEFSTYTGEKLTRISASLPERIADGSGVEIIPELSYSERYIEYNGEYNGERTRSYVINLGTEPPEVSEEGGEASNGTYIVKPIVPSVNAEELLEGLHVTDAAAYKQFRKKAQKSNKYIEKIISKAKYDLDTAEEDGVKYTKRLERQRRAIGKLVDEIKNKVDDAKDAAYRKTLSALEGKRGAYEKTEEKLELTKAYTHDKERLSLIKVNCLALRREKLIIAFNTLSAASITGHDEYIQKAKEELCREMVVYNKTAEECAALIGIKVTPVMAYLADDILEGKTCVDIPRIAVLRELVETVGEESRTVGRCEESESAASCTFIISSGTDKGEVKKVRSNLRTVHGNFFIGNGATGANGASDLADALFDLK